MPRPTQLHSLLRPMAIAIASLALFPSFAFANIPWTWGVAANLPWVILFGLAIEWPVVRYITKLGWWRSLWATIAMNFCSAFAGLVMILLFGYPLIYLAYRIPAVGVVPCLILLVAVDAAIEGKVLISLYDVALDRRGWTALALANLVSVAAVFHGWVF